jgi:hypothetical protein
MKPQSFKPVRLCSAATGVALLFSTTSSSAASGVTVAVEVGPEFVPADDELDSSQWGLGVAARLGYTLDSGWIALTPEGKIGFQSPGTPNSFALLGGARLNLFKGLSPAVFAHAGGLTGELSGFVWDVGVGLDLTLSPVVDVGIFGSYSQVGNASFSSTRFDYESTDWQWVQFGAQCAIHF